MVSTVSLFNQELETLLQALWFKFVTLLGMSEGDDDRGGMREAEGRSGLGLTKNEKFCETKFLFNITEPHPLDLFY